MAKMHAVDLALHGGLGTLLGAGLDQILFVIDAYVPQLTTPTGVKVPLFDQTNGIHVDDVLVQGANAAVLAYGIAKKNPNTIATGLGMFLGSILSSRVQNNPIKPFNVKANEQVNTASVGTKYPNMHRDY